MSRISEVPLGPYAKWVGDFIEISRSAYALLRDDIPSEVGPATSQTTRDNFVIRMSMQAEATSLAARSALTHNLAVPTFALLRVRLEQCIVLSYLIHAAEPDVWKEYLALWNADAGGYVDKSGRFRRRWTKLRPRELAERRDKQAQATTPLPWRLTDEYERLYPLASLAVHGAGETVLWNITLHQPSLASQKRYPYMLPVRARGAAAAIARYDLIQAYETRARLNAPPVGVEQLLEQYNLAAAREV